MARILLFLSLLVPALAGAARSNAPLPEVACRYQMKVSDLSHPGTVVPAASWYFWRTEDMVQTRDDDGDHGEIWERNDHDQVFYRKLYHADKTAVEYMAPDMPADGLRFDWEKLASMLSPDEIARLEVKGNTDVLGRQAEVRSGQVGTQQIEVIWLPLEQLPARLKKTDANRSVELTLVELTPFDKAPVKPLPVGEIDRYRQIDHADFGDMESDPLVKKIEGAGGHSHDH